MRIWSGSVRCYDMSSYPIFKLSNRNNCTSSLSKGGILELKLWRITHGAALPAALPLDITEPL